MTAAPASVGFVGLGNLGGAIAQRFLDAGVGVIGFDTDEDALARFGDHGGIAATSARHVADEAEIVFACLPSVEASTRVALGDDGVGHGTRMRVYAEVSTIGPAAAREIDAGLRARGVSFVDAPVTGTVTAAVAGTLTVMVAGPTPAVESLRPLWSHAAGHVVVVGERPGLAQLVKLINNYVCVAGLVATAEALALGAAAGLDEALVIDVLNHGSGQNWSTSVAFPNVILPRVATGTRVALGLKDLQLYLDETVASGRRSEFTRAVVAAYERVIDADPEGDYVGLYDIVKATVGGPTTTSPGPT